MSCAGRHSPYFFTLPMAALAPRRLVVWRMLGDKTISVNLSVLWTGADSRFCEQRKHRKDAIWPVQPKKLFYKYNQTSNFWHLSEIRMGNIATRNGGDAGVGGVMNSVICDHIWKYLRSLGYVYICQYLHKY